MIELNEQQRQELAKPEPVAIDPVTQQTYVLVRQAAYERLKALLAMDDYDPDEGAALVNDIMADDDPADPLLESYQRYRGATMTRGDVVVVPFPYQDRLGEKIPPALVVQDDRDNLRLANTILAMITGNLGDAGNPIAVLVDPASPDGASSGLSGPSLVKCCNLATVRQRRVLQIIGR